MILAFATVMKHQGASSNKCKIVKAAYKEAIFWCGFVNPKGFCTKVYTASQNRPWSLLGWCCPGFGEHHLTNKTRPFSACWLTSNQSNIRSISWTGLININSQGSRLNQQKQETSSMVAPQPWDCPHVRNTLQLPKKVWRRHHLDKVLEYWWSNSPSPFTITNVDMENHLCLD